MKTQHDHDAEHESFLSGYRDCAEWCGYVIGHEERNSTPGEIDHPWSVEALDAMRADCARFIEANRADLDEACALDTIWMWLGRDFFLSRNGHGAGYLDRGHEPVWKRLQAAARAEGEVTFTVEDSEIVSA